MIHCRRSHIANAAISLIDLVDPTHFVTVTLKQARTIISDGGSASWLRGDDIIYETAYDGFIRTLSKSIASNGSWRRYKRIISNAMTIEGGRQGERNHLHIVMRKPDHVSEDEFRSKIMGAAFGASWFMQGDNAINVQLLGERSDQVSASIYSMKKGLDRFYIAG
jgi:hypothetical protein